MGVERFRSAKFYQEWADKQSDSNIEVVSVVVFNDELVVTWKYV